MANEGGICNACGGEWHVMGLLCECDSEKKCECCGEKEATCFVVDWTEEGEKEVSAFCFDCYWPID